MSNELVYPKLPYPYYWVNDTTINGYNEGGKSENVAWFWKPNERAKPYDDERETKQYECFSSPVGTGEPYHSDWVETEQEAINLIVSFALLGIRKE